jgi:hypothetical protein
MPGYRRLAAEKAWREAAGPALAARSRVRLEGADALEVRVPDEHWRATVAALEGSLLATLQGIVGGEGIRSLRPRIDPELPARPAAEAAGGDAPRPVGGERETCGGEERLRRIARRALARRRGEP